MALTPGAHLANYEITSLLGEGGMGAVYRARDTKLNRDVALKVLLPDVANDPERLARFRREAQVLASLNHPHIGAIYGIEEGPAEAGHHTIALVLELVAGLTLADRIARGPLPLDEALPIAKQIAEALEAAHERGIIHRDLKPANIKVRDDGTVKVLDFGLAKALTPDVGSGDRRTVIVNSPTITSPVQMSGAGMLLGTAAYMAPEQARGRAVDKRADIWAFGCMLFEMLTGRPTFQGDDLADLLSNVLKTEPDWSLLAPEVPAPVRTLIKRCLERDPGRRVADASTLHFVLEEASSLATAVGARHVPAVAVPPARPGLMRHAPVTAAVAVAIALAIPAARHLREGRAELPPLRTEIITPATTDPSSFALSPDGRRIVFAADDAGASRLWIRPLDSSSAQPLAGTENGSSPFWSPDSRAIAFFADGSLKRLDLGGGAPRVVTKVAGSRGGNGAWGADDTIVFISRFGGPLLKIAAGRGEAMRLYKEDDSQAADVLPSFLPDGRRFVFTRTGPGGGIYLGSLDSGEAIRLLGSEGVENVGAFYHASGWLLWSRQRGLVAQHLDLDNRRLVGEIAEVTDSIARAGLAKPAVAGSSTGFIAYRAEHNARRQLTWFDRAGNPLGTAGAPDNAGLSSVALAPDSRRIAVVRTVQGDQDIWVVDGPRTQKLTSDPGVDTWARWSPDGRHMVWGAGPQGTNSFDLYETSLNAKPPEKLPGPIGIKLVNDWSRDGRYVLFHRIDPQTDRDIWVQPMTGDRTPRAFLNTRFDERFGTFSPDSRWVAYESNETGQMEIYIRPFDTTVPGQWQVSTAGGIHPRWRADGKEVFYISPGGALMAVPIAVTETTLAPGDPVQLFQTRIAFGGTDLSGGVQYDVSADGRFLINTLLEDEAGPITLLQNWRPPTP